MPLTRIFIACGTPNGEPNLVTVEVEASEEQILTGEHLDMAKALAAKQGLCEPYVCFDRQQQWRIARHIGALQCPVPILLEDEHHEAEEGCEKIQCHLLFGEGRIAIQLDGHSDYHSSDVDGTVAYIEYWNREVFVRGFTNINSDEPTHNLCFEGARVGMRLPDGF